MTMMAIPLRCHYDATQILQNVFSKAGDSGATELAYRCELTWQQFSNYRDLLISHKMLISSDNNGPNQTYEITSKGIRFLELFREIEDDLRPP
jgi:predicted transcriptional regulator